MEIFLTVKSRAAHTPQHFCPWVSSVPYVQIVAPWNFWGFCSDIRWQQKKSGMQLLAVSNDPGHGERSICYLKRGRFTKLFFLPILLPCLPPCFSPLLGVAKLSESWVSRLSLSDPDVHGQLLWQPLEKQTVLLIQIALFLTPVPLAKSLPPTCCKDWLSSFLF